MRIYNAEEKEKIILELKEFFKLGMSVPKAVNAYNYENPERLVGRQTVYDWINNDDELRIKVESWQNRVNFMARSVWIKHITKDSYEASKEWLARKESDEFGEKKDIKLIQEDPLKKLPKNEDEAILAVFRPKDINNAPDVPVKPVAEVIATPSESPAPTIEAVVVELDKQAEALTETHKIEVPPAPQVAKAIMEQPPIVPPQKVLVQGIISEIESFDVSIPDLDIASNDPQSPLKNNPYESDPNQTV